MRNKNEYKIRMNMTKDKNTDVVLNVYYSVVRRERYFFDLIGPYVWKEYSSWEYWAEGWHIKHHHYSDKSKANELKDKLNLELFRVKVETYADSVIME